MSTAKLPGALLITLFLLGGLSCCSRKASPEKQEAGNPPKKKEPWEWKPDDSKLAAGREIYMTECSLCHNEGDEGAPRLGLAKQWNARAEKGLNATVQRAITGFIGDDGEMPARGGSDYLTDEEMHSAVAYMLAVPRE